MFLPGERLPCTSLSACVQTDHFPRPVGPLTQFAICSPSFSVSADSASGSETCAALSSSAHVRRLLCLCLSVEQKQQLEKETGLKIVEAGVSDVSQALKNICLLAAASELILRSCTCSFSRAANLQPSKDALFQVGSFDYRLLSCPGKGGTNKKKKVDAF